MRSLVLGSASPARLGLLRASGVDARVIASDIDERAVERQARIDDPQLSPAQLAQLLAQAKGEAVLSHLGGTATSTVPSGTGGTNGADRSLILACDSVLEIGGRVHGKPRTIDEARARWRDELRGHSGQLHTGHWLSDGASGHTAESPASATVHFAECSDAEIDGYLATEEPLHVAGAFTLDGLGAPFVESIEGHPSTVIGLCLPVLRRLLADLGVGWWDVASGQSRG